MLRSILHIIFISLISSASFNEFCLNDLSCQNPLICSNFSRCSCPISSSSFWNIKQNTCLLCPRGWTEWQNEKCLLFIAPPQGGVVHQKAKNICLTHSGQLLQIDNYQDFIQFQYKTNELLKGEHANAVIEFLSNSVWINFTDNWMSSYEWCDIEYEYDISPWNDCIRIIKQFSIDKSDTSLCLSHTPCNEKLSYICERSAQIEDNVYDEKDHERIFDAVFGMIGNIFSPGPKATDPPPQPQIIYQTRPPQPQLEQPLPQTSKSKNTILYIGIAVGIIIFICILLCCCFGGGFLLWKSNETSKAPIQPSHAHRRHDRTSVDSTASDATY